MKMAPGPFADWILCEAFFLKKVKMLESLIYIKSSYQTGLFANWICVKILFIYLF